MHAHSSPGDKLGSRKLPRRPPLRASSPVAQVCGWGVGKAEGFKPPVLTRLLLAWCLRKSLPFSGPE